ncbi:hypothetical protein ACFFTM_14710 [Pseudoduganella plicata]|uniref:TonB C-terminal domain-containing protein n=1 Tax=Pseudoduganella plicata TaxID=321984 RepID=A0A4P7BAH8_9BURK|nr:hypothetical protein [Pseudoduganella plicata]QBQ34842.1 hypothetical protein E1742_00550 [Pseudoduganella plicata]GGY88963.1 hypothetical protein GCM10007388_23010 [Pseudoduganella plicata]
MNVILRTAALAALLLAAGSASAAGAKTEAIYKFKDAPRTGSHVARNVAFSAVPFDKRYADLSAAQRDVVRGAYERLGENDEPPFPAYGLNPIFRLLARLDRSLIKAGLLRAAVTVGPDGKPVSVRVLDAPNEFLTGFVGNALLLQDYKPAICAGQPCGQEFLLLATLTDE